MRKLILTALTAVFLLMLTGSTLVSAQAAQTPDSTQAVLNPQPGAPGLGDSLYPGFGNGGYDVQHYDLNLTVDPRTNTISAGIAQIQAIATQDLSSFNLDLIGFDIASIDVNQAAATYSRDGQELTVTPAAPIPNGQAFTATVQYSGVPVSMMSVALPVPTGWIAYNTGTFVLSEPDGAANFFPCNDHPLDKATYGLTVTVPKPYNVAMNGDVTGVTDNGATTTTVSEVNEPMATYLVTINIAQFEIVTEPGTHGVPIRNYFEKGADLGMRDAFARQDEMIGYYASLFGDYPFDVYGAALLNTETGSALENQTLSLFGTDMIDSTDIPYSEITVAHELVHQWFGDSVSLADWRDIWLNEGWATFGEGLWIAHTQGDAAFQQWVRDSYGDAARQDMFPPGAPPADNLFDQSVYTRGGLTLEALRLYVGDTAFFQIAQAWVTRHAYGNATTADFIALADEISGKHVDDLMNAWLYQQPLPPIPEMGLGG